MVLDLSEYPFSTLVYLADENRRVLKQTATLRQDKILNAIDMAGVIRTSFNDFVSCFSPLSSEVGDSYYLVTDKFLNTFMVS